jgi:hypothetical protein
MHATASIHAGSYGDSLAASSTFETPANMAEMDRLEELEAANGSCMKGILVALSIEVAAGILICGVWQFWHFAR